MSPVLRRGLPALLLLVLLAGCSLAWALCSGSYPIAPSEVFAALIGQNQGAGGNIVLELRLPRTLGVFACGGLLALAGALMQVLLRNPLADPFVLGVSGGAAVGALTALWLGATLVWVNLSGFGGALLVMLLVFALAQGDRSWSGVRLLLTGVIVASACGAVVSVLLTLAPEQQLRGMLYWLMGDAGQILDARPAWFALSLGLALGLPCARDLNLLAHGELGAAALGVAVRPLQWRLYGVASLATAVAVTTAGSIGFVGLVAPHLLRLILGNDQRLLLPASVLGGGILLSLADTLAKNLVAPAQLPVGALTALLGAPLFLYLLMREGKLGHGG